MDLLTFIGLNRIKQILMTKNKSKNTKVIIIVLTIAILTLFILTCFADFLKINLVTYYNIIRNLR